MARLDWMNDPLLLEDAEQRLVAAIQEGFPLVERPFEAIGQRVGLSEEAVIATLDQLKTRGIIKRFGIIVRHHELGYQANAMVVWDVPDTQVREVGFRVKDHDFVSLCYRRLRQPPAWPYNLYCMIHGKKREEVLAKVERLVDNCQLHATPRQILFSRRRFKQRGALYSFSNV